ncbi:MAG: T9SS type A sorting domain-containing protein [Sphingobacteriales bacterium]|nr:T9SS type A sorting domain-containing protein [Sphingobacteriales bacterium]
MVTCDINNHTLKHIPTISFVFMLLFIFDNRTKAEELPCANERFQQLLFKDPTYKAYFEAVNQAMQANTSGQKINGAILEIPVVVHVLHLGEPVGTGTNISDEQIIDAVRGANERWRRRNTTEGVDMEIQFCLAQTDPNGNPTNGIVRKDASGIEQYKDYGIGYIGALGQPGSDEAYTKNFSNWPHTYVYNIWVVNKIAGGWGGYAFFPFSFNYPTDGVVIVANSIKYSSSTLAHELGHGMGLFHTFQGDDNGCPIDGICAIFGDWVCDTPPHRQPDCGSSSCNNGTNANNSYRNIMSYCNNRSLFTQGQKSRSRDIITTTTRNALLSSAACTPPPCLSTFSGIDNLTCNEAESGVRKDTLLNAGGCDSIITTTTTLLPSPIADFSYSVSGNEVTFTDLSEHYNTLLWNFGDDSTSTAISPTHNYSLPGNYTISLSASNNCATDTTYKEIEIAFTTNTLNSNYTHPSVYPNPNNGIFNVRTSVAADEKMYLQLFNQLGQLIFQQQLFQGKEHTIRPDAVLPKGVYFLTLTRNYLQA